MSKRGLRGAAAGFAAAVSAVAIIAAGGGRALAQAVSPAESVPAVAAGPGLIPHDLTPIGMFLNASPVVQAVMVGLAFASVVTWTVWLAKTWELWNARFRLNRAYAGIEAAGSLDAAAKAVGDGGDPASAMVCAALAEVRQSADMPVDGIHKRVSSYLERLEASAGRKMIIGTGVLASIGSTAPFVGLFGTVWGIMTAFIGISKANTTSLAVVAPGIAEALLATAMGLAAAIPAVIVYNVFFRSIGGYKALLADVSAAVLRQVGRELDRRELARCRSAAAE